jgi:hypothetical protein
VVRACTNSLRLPRAGCYCCANQPCTNWVQVGLLCGRMDTAPGGIGQPWALDTYCRGGHDSVCSVSIRIRDTTIQCSCWPADVVCVWFRSMAIRHKKYDVVRTLVTRFNADVGLESCGYTPLILAAINDGT